MSESLRRPVIFGEVLFDHFPDGSVVMGGAPFNVAWHLHAFGLKPLMVSRIGSDALGAQIETAMRAWGMDCSGLQHDSSHPTGTVEVSFSDGEPSYEIVDAVAYDYIDAASMPELDGRWLLYHGSLALRHEASAMALAQLKEAVKPDCFVDVNLRQPWWQPETALEMIAGAEWVKLNGDELAALYPDGENSGQRLATLTDSISGYVVLTGGKSGATLVTSHQEKRLSIRPDSEVKVVDTVGAGDAFCSVILAGLLLEWPLDITMQRAQQFASAIVGVRGALSRERRFYRQFCAAWGIGSQNHV